MRSFDKFVARSFSPRNKFVHGWSVWNWRPQPLIASATPRQATPGRLNCQATGSR
jgi:hypothetical protein